jgi:hypothetical protein
MLGQHFSPFPSPPDMMVLSCEFLLGIDSADNLVSPAIRFDKPANQQMVF